MQHDPKTQTESTNRSSSVTIFRVLSVEALKARSFSYVLENSQESGPRYFIDYDSAWVKDRQFEFLHRIKLLQRLAKDSDLSWCLFDPKRNFGLFLKSTSKSYLFFDGPKEPKKNANGLKPLIKELLPGSNKAEEANKISDIS